MKRIILTGGGIKKPNIPRNRKIRILPPIERLKRFFRPPICSFLSLSIIFYSYQHENKR